MDSTVPRGEPNGPRTLVELIERRSGSDDTWLILPTDPIESDSAIRLSYREMCLRARRIADLLVALGGKPQQNVVLVFDNSADFCAAFLGVVLAGMVPVPLHPPYFAGDLDGYRDSIRRVLDECDAHFILVEDALGAVFAPFDVDSAARVLTTSDLTSGSEAQKELPCALETDSVLIQYSSGSTRTPLGVELSHANVLHNLRGIQLATDARSTDVALCWLPLFHDMGLTGSLLLSFYCGMSLVLMSPRDFVARPASWLWAMARFRCDGCAAPNFAYSLCASTKKVPDRVLRGLDLGAWRVAFWGAEAVQPATIDAFARRFGPFGFRRNAIYPVYGLAEDVVACCFPGFGEEPRVDQVDRDLLERHGFAAPAAGTGRARGIVSVGRALANQQVRVVDELDRDVRERAVGHVQVRGACVMKGYFNRPAETREQFSSDGWLRTGDLGYFAHGDLFIVGREKEIIKKAGARYDAADIQAIVSSVPGVRPGGAAVFAVDDPESGTAAIVAVVETRTRGRSELNALQLSIANHVRRVFATRIDRIVFVGAGALPKSTSGKVRGANCKSLFLQGKIRGLDENTTTEVGP